MEGLGEAVARADVDELLRLVEACCSARDWDALVSLADRCRRAAKETGRQLWPVAHHAEYRLALEAPAPFAAAVLVEGAARFALGPLAEVAAQGHTWAELAPYAPIGVVASMCAHERVVRGEVVEPALVPPGPDPLELPWALQPWEPAYALAEYHADRVEFQTPSGPALHEVALPAGAVAVVDDRPVTRALAAVAATWTTASNGRVEAVAVDGDAAAAVRALGVRRARFGRLDLAGGLAWLAWAGASGGAHGRRRGAATGRFEAWLALAALVGLDDDWPADADALGEAGEALEWWAWDAAEPVTGWALRLAVADPARGRAWAVVATDAA